jgi:hypothetical protein
MMENAGMNGSPREFLEWRRCEGERGGRVGGSGWKVKLRRR